MHERVLPWSVDASSPIRYVVKCGDCGGQSKHEHFERYDEYLETVSDNVAAKQSACKSCEGTNTAVIRLQASIYIDDSR